MLWTFSPLKETCTIVIMCWHGFSLLGCRNRTIFSITSPNIFLKMHKKTQISSRWKQLQLKKRHWKKIFFCTFRTNRNVVKAVIFHLVSKELMLTCVWSRVQTGSCCWTGVNITIKPEHQVVLWSEEARQLRSQSLHVSASAHWWPSQR